MNTILQIVPRVPGGIDGVGDYALTIAQKLRDEFGVETVFAAPDPSAPANISGFDVLAWSRLVAAGANYNGVVLHYVNYGFQKRGIPFDLLPILRRLRQQNGGKFVTIFHEFYASGPPWRSEFWLRPFQVHLARKIARLADQCVVSTPKSLRELRALVPEISVHLHPVPSGLGEPLLSPEEIENRDPHKWVIVGGTVLGERSLRSFRENLHRIPDSIAPQRLIVIGGHENPSTRQLLRDLEIESEYRPNIAAADASGVLRSCSFAWFNYFARSDIETSVLLKSSAFAAACAHGLISVLPHRGTPISIEGDDLPGPFFIESDVRELPSSPQDRPRIAGAIYDWYWRNVSSDKLVRGLTHALGINCHEALS